MRSSFGSTRLVGLLGEWNPVAGEAPGPDFAEHLSRGLSAFDAMDLQAVLRSIRVAECTAPARPAAVAVLRAESLEEPLRRVRAALGQAIARDPIVAADRHPTPAAIQGEALTAFGVEPAAISYRPYRQRHLELQRQMEQAIAPLREQVRRGVSGVSPRLRHLAALDAVFEQLLAAREQQILPTAARLLERRFEQLRAVERQQADAIGPVAEPDAAPSPPAWLKTFDGDWRRALAAELDLRLEPVTGLLEALAIELKKQQ